MSDITKCTNKTCVMKDICKRSICQPHEFRQAYSEFEPKINTATNFDCSYFIKTTKIE